MTNSLPQDATLERILQILEAHNPSLLDLLMADTEEKFIAATEGGLERAIVKIEGNAKEFVKLDERGLSALLTGYMSQAGWGATAERSINGHVDIVIEARFGRPFMYLGECKIYDGYKYHIDGCEQLLGYCTGREKRAFSLDFFKTGGMYTKLVDLSKRMDKEKPLSQNAESMEHGKMKGAFLTSHRHDSGADIELLHAGCSVNK